MRIRLLLLSFLGSFIFLTGTAQINYNVDVFPTNIGGKSEFLRVFHEQLQYPSTALESKAGGKVTVHFVVNKDSTISNVSLVSCNVSELDKEALRLFRLYKWVPGIKNGVYVSCNWTAEFEFNPSKYAKICKERGYTAYNYFKEHAVDTSLVIVKLPEQIPMYEKGNYALQDFIKENLEYPRQAQLSNIQGTVLLSFIVEPNGTITNIGVEKSVGGGCDQEAIRVLQLIHWYPAIHGDKYVRAPQSLPFYFVLNEDFKDNSAGEQK